MASTMNVDMISLLGAAMSVCEPSMMQCAQLVEVQMCAAHVLNADTLIMF